MSGAEFDAIVVGARVAGSAAALLLARQGRRVLMLDKTTFPSDTISTHIVLAGGTRVLKQLGALDELVKAGAMLLPKAQMRSAEFDYVGRQRDIEGASIPSLCLGRMRMDAAMVKLARDASVTVREGFRVSGLIVEKGAVVGVRGEDDSGHNEFRARLTIGADGMHSAVARLGQEALGAFARDDVPCARAYYYAYFDGVSEARLDDTVVAHLAQKPYSDHIACRCEDGKAVFAAGFDRAELQEFKSDLAANFERKLKDDPVIAEMLAAARLSSRIYSVGNLNNTYRNPACDGCLLLGDAGLHVDPLLGQGHSFALISAAIMAELAPRWFESNGGPAVPALALDEFTRRRDTELGPHFNATLAISRTLEIDPMMLTAGKAASTAQWAADEMISFSQMLIPPTRFPTMRYARLMGQAMAAK